MKRTVCNYNWYIVDGGGSAESSYLGASVSVTNPLWVNDDTAPKVDSLTLEVVNNSNGTQSLVIKGHVDSSDVNWITFKIVTAESPKGWDEWLSVYASSTGLNNSIDSVGNFTITKEIDEYFATYKYEDHGEKDKKRLDLF